MGVSPRSHARTLTTACRGRARAALPASGRLAPQARPPARSPQRPRAPPPASRPCGRHTRARELRSRAGTLHTLPRSASACHRRFRLGRPFARPPLPRGRAAVPPCTRAGAAVPRRALALALWRLAVCRRSLAPARLQVARPPRRARRPPLSPRRPPPRTMGDALLPARGAAHRRRRRR